MRRIAILDAPSNLGLRPPTETSVPGCAKAPGALRDHDLVARLSARDAGCLTPPRYDPGDWRPGDGVCHAEQIAAYSAALADRIGGIIDAGEFPVVLGGDCSILLGSALAMHRLGEVVGGRIGLVFVDGHSDFRHPGNASYVGAAAGEDLALATGRGQADLAGIEGRRPYFRDVDVVVLGIRAQDEYRLDLQAAGIITRPVPALRVEGAARTAQWARDQLSDCAGYWVHVDVDVLDPAVMPAVDAPDPGGIAFAELELLLTGLVDTPHCLGVELTVFDPDYDPDGSYAAEIVEAVVAGLAPLRMADPPPPSPSPSALAGVEPSSSHDRAGPGSASPAAGPSPGLAAAGDPSPGLAAGGVPSPGLAAGGGPPVAGGSPVGEPSLAAGGLPDSTVEAEAEADADAEAEAGPAHVAPTARKPLDAESEGGLAPATTPGTGLASSGSGSGARVASAAGSGARGASAGPGTVETPTRSGSSAASDNSLVDGGAAASVRGDSEGSGAAAPAARKPPAARKAPDDEPRGRKAARGSTTRPKTEPESGPRRKAERASGPQRKAEPASGPQRKAEPASGPRGTAEPASGLRGKAEPASGLRGKAEPEPGPRPKPEPATGLRRKAESAWMDVAADLAARRGTPAERAARRATISGPAGLRRSDDDSGPATLRRGGEAEPAWKDDEREPPHGPAGEAEPHAREGSAHEGGDPPDEETATEAGTMPVPAFEPFGPPAKAGPGRLRRPK